MHKKLFIQYTVEWEIFTLKITCVKNFVVLNTAVLFDPRNLTVGSFNTDKHLEHSSV